VRLRACAAAVLLASVLTVRPARAQGRYRVVVGSSETLRGAVVEFRPCVPAEGSDCGARIERSIDFAGDSAEHAPPAAVLRAQLWNARDSLVLDRGAISQRAPRARAAVLRDRRGDAVALAADAPYAFILLAGQRSGHDPDVVVMYDTDTHSIIANCALRDRATGVRLAPIR